MLADLSGWLVSIEGTGTGRRLALILAIAAAALHAAFGALQKGRHDPWVSRAAIDASYLIFAIPLALFAVPWPEPVLWPIFAGVWIIHVIYKVLQAMAYSRGAYTVVYPVVRGTGPLATVIVAGFVFGERFSVVQWSGVATLTCGILGLAAFNLRHVHIDRATLVPALFFAAMTGVWVAAYTNYDAFGIRLAVDPLTFIVWFFVIDGLTFPALIGVWVWQGKITLPRFGPLALRGMAGGLIGPFSFGSIMLATRLDNVGEAAVLRETSVIFAAAIGWIFLRESVGMRRFALMILIAFGAVLVEAGG